MASTLITAGDASNGLVTTGGNDNTLTIQTGAAGAKVNAIALASDGTATLLQPPKLAATATVSMVRVNTANGYGSSSTKIRRFTNVVTNTGTDITYADSATLGASFTINTNGVYAISHTDNFTGTQNLGLSLNTSSPTTNIQNLAATEALGSCSTGGANFAGSVSWIGYLSAGAVVRPHGDGSAAGTGAPAQFTITRVA